MALLDLSCKGAMLCVTIDPTFYFCTILDKKKETLMTKSPKYKYTHTHTQTHFAQIDLFIIHFLDRNGKGLSTVRQHFCLFVAFVN